MAKVTLMEPYASVRGTICRHNIGGGMAVNRVLYSQQILGRYCNKYTGEYTTEQLANQQKFKTAATNTAARIKQALSADVEAFKAQTKYKNLWTFIFADEYSKL